MVSGLTNFAGCKIAAAKKVFYRFFFHLFTLFKRLFAPTSLSPMSKLFRFLESLGESNGKKWSQIWKLLLRKGVKLPRIFFFFFFFFFCEFCLTSRIFSVLVLLFTSVKRCVVSRMRDFFHYILFINIFFHQKHLSWFFFGSQKISLRRKTIFLAIFLSRNSSYNFF